MHAVLVTVSIEAGREEEGSEHLRSNVVPAVKQIPGLVSGYWLSSRDGQGLTVLLFENEQAAQAAASAIPDAPRPDFVTIDAVELSEVVAHT